MAEEKKGKEPEDQGGAGGNPEQQEAGGRISLSYTCWYCGRVNIVNGAWSWFTCWHCGRLNRR